MVNMFYCSVARVSDHSSANKYVDALGQRPRLQALNCKDVISWPDLSTTTTQICIQSFPMQHYRAISSQSQRL